MRSGDVLSMGSVQSLHHLDAKAAIVREKHGELGQDVQGLHLTLSGWMTLCSAPPSTTRADVAANPADSSSLRLD